jgi:hypothetical protein
MSKSYTDHLLEIEEIAQDNDFIKSLLLDMFHKNLPDEINKKNKGLLNDLYFSLVGKSNWQCEHMGCSDESCYSHEISENIFLKNLSNNESRVYILKRDMKGNPMFYIEDAVHKRNASNFPGYCSNHDADLFRDIENGEQELNKKFINKQCLRTVRREKFEISLQIRMADAFLKSIEDELLEFDETQDVINHFKNKIQILEKRLDRASTIYNNIYRGIDTGNYVIDYKEVLVTKSGYCFSMMLECTDEEKDSELCLLFLYKLDFGGNPKAIICMLDNKISKDEADKMTPTYKYFFIKAMHDKKERLILSQSFVMSLSEHVKNLMYSDSDLCRLGSIENMVMSQEFF